MVCLVVLLPFSISTQSFVNPEIEPNPAPNYTIIEIEDCPSVYAIYVDIEGPALEYPHSTIYDQDITIINPDVTLTYGGSFLQKMTFDYGEIPTS